MTLHQWQMFSWAFCDEPDREYEASAIEALRAYSDIMRRHGPEAEPWA